MTTCFDTEALGGGAKICRASHAFFLHGKKPLHRPAPLPYFPARENAGVAQLVEHLVANENVESSNLFARSPPFLTGIPRQGCGGKVVPSFSSQSQSDCGRRNRLKGTPGNASDALECGGKRKRHAAFGWDCGRASVGQASSLSLRTLTGWKPVPHCPPKAVSALVPRSATALQGLARDLAASFRESPKTGDYAVMPQSFAFRA